MASVIRVLEDETINQIAAGEVVENPASVVKELVENALDAKADSITLEIKAGGFQQIKVSDNGSGMSQDDTLLALERHATSKIKKINDLLSISSMGFRGEALASIASISKFSINTATENPEHSGTSLLSEGGKIKYVSKCSRQKGTSIEVRSLFYNVPARKKFQKSPPVSLAEITKIYNTLALSRPDVEFKYYCEGKLMLHAKKNPKLSQKEMMILRAIDVLGKGFVEDIKYVCFKQDHLEIEGLLGSPKFSKTNRLGQYLFINTRSVVSSDVSFAVSDGYASMLPEKRYPIFLLYLSMSSKDVDVNVHPQKKQVKFKETSSVKAFIRQAVGKTLDKQTNVQTPQIEENSSFGFFSKKAPLPNLDLYRQSVKTFKKGNSEDILPQTTVIYENTESKIDQEISCLQLEQAYVGLYKHYALFKSQGIQEIFQSSLEGLICVNLKTMQQRLHYEKVLKSFESSDQLEREASLFPEKISFSKAEANNLLQKLHFLLKLGIELRSFGTDTFVIESLSPLYSLQDVKDFLFEIASENVCDDALEIETKKKLAQRAAYLATSKCRDKTGSIALIRTFLSMPNVNYSFKGEPVLTTITDNDIEKLFRK